VTWIEGIFRAPRVTGQRTLWCGGCVQSKHDSLSNPHGHY
jgi:hypothetical protein